MVKKEDCILESKAASHRKIGDLLIFYLQYTPWGYIMMAEADDMKARCCRIDAVTPKCRRTQAPQKPDATERRHCGTKRRKSR